MLRFISWTFDLLKCKWPKNRSVLDWPLFQALVFITTIFNLAIFSLLLIFFSVFFFWSSLKHTLEIKMETESKFSLKALSVSAPKKYWWHSLDFFNVLIRANCVRAIFFFGWLGGSALLPAIRRIQLFVWHIK